MTTASHNRSALVERAVLAGLLLLYVVVSLRHLGTLPRVYEDEPWQASTGWKLAREGVFGSDLFAGLDGMDRRYYGYMPVFPLLLALMFQLGGLGLVQARLTGVLLGLLALLLTYALGRRLVGARAGLLALALLLLVRLTPISPTQPTGIPWLDSMRIARYDTAVPALGLAALHTYLSARGNRGRYLLAGGLAGLSGLAHLYGLFWVIALGALALWEPGAGGRGPGAGGRGPRWASLISGPWPLAPLLIGLGALLAWLPYVVYVLGDLASWRAQTLGYGERFGLLDPAWYVSNLLREPQRYGLGWAALGRPGVWAALLGLPAALGALLLRGLRGDAAARALAVPGLLFPLLFALLISLKLPAYLGMVYPLWALAAAWGLLQLWGRSQKADDRRPRTAGGGRLIRPGLALLGVLLAAEGALQLAAFERAAAATTPYARLSADVRALLPADTRRVLGLHTYWLGLERYDYRSFAVPALWSTPYGGAPGLPFAAGLDRISPDALLIDPRMRDYFTDPQHGGTAAGAALATWMADHGAVLLGQIDDPTYGVIDVYRVGSREMGVRGGRLGARGWGLGAGGWAAHEQ